MLQEQKSVQEKPLDIEQLKSDLTAFVDEFYNPEKDSNPDIKKSLEAMRVEYKNAIAQADLNSLEKLAIAIENKLDYERKDRHSGEGKMQWDRMELLRKKLLAWIEHLIIN
ncbi:hypothetical protein HQ571_01595 [Candidatus Kuenenbacteria bacterium]|nr:hypothetical protein [Candidatus Kuenenbacteria bacterium]